MFIEDEFNRAFQRAFRSFQGLDGLFGEVGTSKAGRVPYYYGYAVTIGPDGQPVVKEYGNVRPEGLQEGEKQPLVDTIENEKDGVTKLVAELPGVAKSDISVTVDGTTVSIDAERGERKYHAKVPLKRKVENDSATASYQNGILEIVLRLAAPEKPKGRTVEVH